ncbi:TIGR04255 family protein [uncultured Maribacter sp.]|uniref:TIGR04255 family protein n=1 Tax=uncultured Maribacter sp. TaxID=431308 RepID=UPI00262104FC|nr:TIGR04255 family protein [uncultured Maribacter sp.]
MIEFLKPISENHAISKAVASVFIPQAFLKPQDIFEKTKINKGFENYPKKGLMKATTININNNSLGITNEQIKGFVFENYDDIGSINNIFKLENNKENQSIISLENRKYINWESFKNTLDSDLDAFSTTNDFYVEAISLNYRDEFIWTNRNEKIPVDVIFNIDSELLNKKFLASKNGTLVLISQGNDLNGIPYEEKTEISFNNDIKRIIVDHQYASLFGDIKLFSDLKLNNKFSSLFDLAHQENKKILRDILTKDCQDLIKLK